MLYYLILYFCFELQSTFKYINMKSFSNNTIKKIITVIVWMILFYKQSLACNLFLFTIFLAANKLVEHYNTIDKQKITFTCILLSVSFSAYYFNDAISIILCLVGIFIYPFFMEDTFQVSVLSIINSVESFKYNLKELTAKLFRSRNATVNASYKIKVYVLLPLSILVLFLVIYSFANPTFYNWVCNIIEFIDFTFIIYLLVGVVFASYFYNYFSTNYFERNYRNIFRNNLIKNSFISQDEEKLHIFKNSGVIILSILNAILCIFIIAEFQQISEISTKLHATNTALVILEIFDCMLVSIVTIIVSIIIAMTILFVYFKNEINFLEGNQRIKKLAYGWIVLNSMLLITASIKVYLSIEYSGFTIKRIGIYGFLVLAIFGLIYTFIKIKDTKTNYYVVRKMVWTVAIFIGVISPINFSSFITKQNFRLLEKKHKPIEIWRLVYEIHYNYAELIPYLKSDKVTKEEKNMLTNHITNRIYFHKQKSLQSSVLYDVLVFPKLQLYFNE